MNNSANQEGSWTRCHPFNPPPALPQDSAPPLPNQRTENFREEDEEEWILYI